MSGDVSSECGAAALVQVYRITERYVQTASVAGSGVGVTGNISHLSDFFATSLARVGQNHKGEQGKKARRKNGGAWSSGRRSGKESKVGDTFWVSPGVLREEIMTCLCVTMQACVRISVRGTQER